MESERDLQKKIDEARSKLSDLDALRIERDHIFGQISDGQKRISALQASLADEEKRLAAAKASRAQLESSKNQELLDKEMALNDRSVGIVGREKKVADAEALLARTREDHLNDRKNLVDEMAKHSVNATNVSERSARLDQRERDLAEKESAFADRLRTHGEREYALDAREKAISEREGANLAQKGALDRREEQLSASEQNITLQKVAFDKRSGDLMQAEKEAAAGAAKNAEEREGFARISNSLDERSRGLASQTGALTIRESTLASKELDVRVRESELDKRERNVINREILLKNKEQ